MESMARPLVACGMAGRRLSLAAGWRWLGRLLVCGDGGHGMMAWRHGGHGIMAMAWRMAMAARRGASLVWPSYSLDSYVRTTYGTWWWWRGMVSSRYRY